MDCEVEMLRSSAVGLSPSFNRYDSGRLAEIAARILGELGESEFQAEIETQESVSSLEFKAGNGDGEVIGENDDEEVKEDGFDSGGGGGGGGGGDDDDDDEFTFYWREPETSPISADEIFFNGEIRPIFPIFNRNLLISEEQNQEVLVKPATPASIRLPLRKLLIEERGTASCSSSEADELDGVPPGTYCVWTPKPADESPPGRCRKSNSTGSSKRWKFRDFLHRSNSDGKDTFVFLTPNSSTKKNIEKEATSGAGKPKPPKSVTGENVTSSNRKNNTAAKKEAERRRSFLPYRQDLVGFFANVNGLSRNLHPF